MGNAAKSQYKERAKRKNLREREKEEEKEGRRTRRQSNEKSVRVEENTKRGQNGRTKKKNVTREWRLVIRI